MQVMRYYEDLKNSEHYKILMESNWVEVTGGFVEKGEYIKFILTHELDDNTYSIHVLRRDHQDLAILIKENITDRVKAIDKFHHIVKYGFDPTIDRKIIRKNNKPKSKRKICRCKS